MEAFQNFWTSRLVGREFYWFTAHDIDFTLNYIKMTGFSSLPTSLCAIIISEWIKLKDLVRLDSAYCNHSTRLPYLNSYQSGTLRTECIKLRSPKMMQWFISRSLKFRKLSTILLKWQEGIDILLSELLANIGSHVKEISIRPSRKLSSLQIICFSTIFAQNCMNIQKAQLTGELSDSEIAPLLCAWKSIQELDFKDCEITSGSFFILSNICSNLKRLTLNIIDDVSDAGLTALAGKCPELHTLTILFCDNITVKGVLAFVVTTPKLNVLRITMSYLTDTDISTISQHCPMLHTIGIDAMSVTDVGIQALVNHCPELIGVYLINSAVISSGFTLFRNLKHLKIHNSPTITDTMVAAIVQNNPLLEYLILYNCTQLTFKAVLTILQGCSALHTLTVTTTTTIRITEHTQHHELVKALIESQYPKITELEIYLK